MPRTQIRREDIGNQELTGASFDPAMDLYNETVNYNSGDLVIWKTDTYQANKAITRTTEGDLSNNPEVSSDWDKIVPINFVVVPSSTQSFTTTDTVLALDTVVIADPFTRVELDTANNALKFNISGNVMIEYSYTAKSETTTRTESTCWLEISVDGGSNWSKIGNSTSYAYHRTTGAGATTATMLVPLEVNTDDLIRLVMVNNTDNSIKTVLGSNKVTVFTTSGVSGPKGDKGDTGQPGDIIWTGPWDNNRTYNDNEAVEYLGSSYVSTANNNTETPSDTATNWDLLASKGDSGSGTTITVADEGTNIQNTPHSTLNFKGDIVTATDAGNGIADITIVPKYEYMMPIWAEENAGLNSNTYEWAFGNGANTPSGHGVTIYVPVGYTAEIVALSLTCQSSGTDLVAEVQCEITDGTGTTRTAGSVTVDQPTNASIKATTELSTPATIVNNETVNFKTVSVSGSTTGPNVVTAFIKYKLQ
jgi:hypothetical protein